MNLYPIVIVAIVLVADGARFSVADALGLSGVWVTATAVCVPIGLLAMLWAAIGRLARQAERSRNVRTILKAGRLGRAVRMMLVANHALVVLGLGWLQVIRSWTGDLLLVDELIAMTPPILGLAATWWIDYPIERRLRNAMLIRRLDTGVPVYPTPGRWGYTLMQLRMQLLPLLVPLLLIVAFGELIRMLAVGIESPGSRYWIEEGATLAAAACVFIVAPVLAKTMLSVRRLPDSPLRRELLDVCSAHNVKVRDVLVWNTGGVMINAAVMGLVGRLRYILMTDALLDTMDRRQLVAVMAHEIGHVRKHHMPWMVIALIAILLAASTVVWLPLVGLDALGAAEAARSSTAEGVATTCALVIAFLVFGWVSRRFERQADTFAVRHFSAHPLPESGQDRDAPLQASAGGGAEAEQSAGAAVSGNGGAAGGEPYDSRGAITPESVDVMQSALQTIAELNMVDPHRRSWRHGSIVWRQQYLQSLVGAPQGQLPIDRTVGWIKAAAVAVLVLLGALQVVLMSLPQQRAVAQGESVFALPTDVCDATILHAE